MLLPPMLRCYDISPEYFQAAGTSLLAGRAFSWHDDKNAPRVAVVNQLFARRVFGSVPRAMGRYFKMEDGTRVQVVGVVEDGKYYQLTEAPQPAMFLPFLQSPTSLTCLVVRSGRDREQLAAAIRSTLRDLDPSLPLEHPNLDPGAEHRPVSLACGNGVARCARQDGRDALDYRHLWNGRLLRQQAAARVRNPHRARRAAQRSTCGPLSDAPSNSSQSVLRQDWSWDFWRPRPRLHRVSGNSPRPVGIGGCCLGYGIMGLLATWIPAQRALSVDPLILLREE